MPFAGFAIFDPYATTAIRPRLRLPRTIRLVLRTSVADSGRSKRLYGVANAAPNLLGHLKVAN